MEIVHTKVGIIGFVVGTVLGSFTKALADRSLSNRTFWGRSYCFWCKHQLHWYDLFPIVSYLLLRGKCRYCHKAIGIEHLLVEVVMGLIIAFLFYQSFPNFKNIQDFFVILDIVFKSFFITILAILFLTDLKKMLIPDQIVLPAIILAAIYLIAVTLLKIGYLYYSLSQTFIGKLLLPPHSDYFQRHAMIIVEPFVWAVVSGLLIAGFFYGLILITKGKGMGGGDVSLGAFMGLSLGFPASLLAVTAAFLIGAIYSIILILLGKKHFKQNIAFGPFLVMGSLLALFWADKIINWYLHFGA